MIRMKSLMGLQLWFLLLVEWDVIIVECECGRHGQFGVVLGIPPYLPLAFSGWHEFDPTQDGS